MLGYGRCVLGKGKESFNLDKFIGQETYWTHYYTIWAPIYRPVGPMSCTGINAGTEMPLVH